MVHLDPINIFPRIQKYTGLNYNPDSILTRDNYNVDNETVFRWICIPFIVADVMRDYLDTCYDIAAMLKLSDVKKLIREIKNVESDYLYERKLFFKDNIRNLEEQKAEKLQDDIKDTIHFICKRLYDDIEKQKPSSELDMKMFIGATYMAYFIYSGIMLYTNEYINIILTKFGYHSRNMMPKTFFKFKDLLSKLTEVYVKIDDINIRLYSNEIKTIMHSIVLFDKEPESNEADQEQNILC